MAKKSTPKPTKINEGRTPPKPSKPTSSKKK